MKRLSSTQRCIISDLVREAINALEWDEDMQCYADGGRMIVTMSEEEYEELKKISIY